MIYVDYFIFLWNREAGIMFTNGNLLKIYSIKYIECIIYKKCQTLNINSLQVKKIRLFSLS